MQEQQALYTVQSDVNLLFKMSKVIEQPQ